MVIYLLGLLSLGTETIAAIIGAIGGGLFVLLGVMGEHWLEGRRRSREEKERWVQTALDWHNSGGLTSLRRAQLAKANLYRVDLTVTVGGGQIESVPGIKGADLGGANLRSADLTWARLYGVSLEHANCTGAKFVAASMARVNAFGAVLRGAILMDAELSDACLAGADLRGANLQGAKHLHTAQLYDVRYNRHTRWPKDFTPPPSA